MAELLNKVGRPSTVQIVTRATHTLTSRDDLRALEAELGAEVRALASKAAVRFDDDVGVAGFLRVSRPRRRQPPGGGTGSPSGDRLGGAGHRAASPTVAASGKRHRGRARGAQQPGRRVAALASALVLTARADDAPVPASVSVPM